MIDLNIVHLCLIFLGIIFLIKIPVSMLPWITSPFFRKKETEVLPPLEADEDSPWSIAQDLSSGAEGMAWEEHMRMSNPERWP